MPPVERCGRDGMSGQNLKQPLYRFVIADDHPLFRGALREAVAGSFGAQYPGVPVVVVSGNQDLTVVRRCMEFGASGFIPKTLPVEMIREAIGKVLDGAVWYPSDVDPALGADSETRQLVSRLAGLTPQQVRVLMMLSEGLLNKQIAYALGVSEATVKAHVSAILQKLGVDSRTQAVIIASKIDPEQWQQAAESGH